MARAGLLRLLAAGLAYPVPGHVEAVQRDFRKSSAAARGGAFAPGLAAKLRLAQRAWLTASSASLAGEYLRLFSGSGPVSLHETSYGDAQRIAGRAVELSDIGGFYSAFGFGPSDGNPDLPDHLGAELEYLSALMVKEAYALSRGWQPRARLAREAARKFLEHHLGRWTGVFAKSLAQAGASPVFRATAALIEAAVAAECRHLGARPALIAGRQPGDDMQAEILACPMDEARREGGAA